LAEKEVFQEYYDWGGEVFSEDYLISKRLHFIEGFNKAMELNQSKLFTRENMIWARDSGYTNFMTEEMFFDKLDMHNQQPTEIDVEIEMEEVIIGQCDCECHSNTSIMHFMACCNPKIFTEPKLDENGCLILKRK
jgi:hypothetical protein